MIEDIRQTTGHGIRQICASLQVPRSSFYHAASPTATQSEDRRIGDRIETIFRRHRRRYGYRRIGEELSDAGEVCAPVRIRRIMRQRGLRAIQPKTCVPKNQRWPGRQALSQPASRPTAAAKARPGLGRGHLPAPSGAAFRAKAPPFGYLVPLGSFIPTEVDPEIRARG